MRLKRGKIVRQAGERLRSEKGVSLPLVLFLFLICAMASAIVLAAATASTGRFAQLTESDRMYYSVSSAASFMKDYIEDQGEVVVERTHNADGSFTGSITVGGTTRPLPMDASYSPSFMERISLFAVFGTEKVVNEAQIIGNADNGWEQDTSDPSDEGYWYDGFPVSGPKKIGGNMTIDVSAGDTEVNSLLSSQMTASFDAAGDLLLTLAKSGDNGSAANLTVTCQPGFETSTSTSRGAGGGTTTTETIHITWSVSEVTKGSAGE